MADKDTLEAKVAHLTQCKESLEREQETGSPASNREKNDSPIGNGVCEDTNGNSDVMKESLSLLEGSEGDHMSYDELKNDLVLAQERIESLQGWSCLPIV